MFRKLTADEIDARVATVTEKGCSLLLYKDARVDMNILDETFGVFGWQRKHEIIDGRLYCTVSVFDKNTNQWVSKQDVGTESYTEKEKGQASDSFKRACFNWGIGRELYTAPFIWIKAGDVNLTQKNGKFTTYDRFNVKEIAYDDKGNICKLSVANNKGEVVYGYNVKVENNANESTEKAPEQEAVQTTDKITDKEALVLEGMLKGRTKMKNGILKQFEIKSLKDLTKEQCAEVHEAIKAFNEKLAQAEELKEKCDAVESKTA